MASKKETWNLDKDGKGTKVTVDTRDDGYQKTTVQEASTNWFGYRNAGNIISTSETTVKKK